MLYEEDSVFQLRYGKHAMCRQKLMACLAMATMLVLAAGTGPVRAGGYWNMPGTLSQRTGHGYSGGYHAPFILGPIRFDGWGSSNEVRWPCAPCCSCPHAYCRECNTTLDTPSTLEGTVPTAKVPVVAQPAQSPPAAPLVPDATQIAAPAPRGHSLIRRTTLARFVLEWQRRCAKPQAVVRTDWKRSAKTRRSGYKVRMC